MIQRPRFLLGAAMLAAARLSCGEPETSGKNDRPVPVDGRCDDLQEPVLVRRVEPSYPAHIRKQGWEGQVELKGIIGSDGKVSDLSVLKSPGKPLSDLAAQAVSQWVYKPAYCKDLEKPVRVSIIFRTSFTLKHK